MASHNRPLTLPVDSIHAARHALQSGEMAPDDLIAATLDRIRALNPKLNAYLDVFDPPERTAGLDLPLGGVPIAIKDLIDVAGRRTTAGSPFMIEHVAAEDAAVVRKLRAAGAVLTGKTHLHEWAHGTTNDNPHFGPCRNPWDLERVSGGSSGGSAVAVAAGLCLGALGTDTGGSIRIPASLCGIVGLKPTRGRVSLRGVVPLSWSLDHVGPMARTVRDAAILLGAIAGHDPEDPASIDAPVPDYAGSLDGETGLRGARIGVPEAFFFEESEPEVVEAVRAAIETLRSLGGTIVEMDLRQAAEVTKATGVILMADAAAFHRERFESQPDKFGADVRDRIKAGRAFTATDYALARHAQRQWRRRLSQVFQSVDVLAMPATQIAAPRIGEPEAGARLPRFTRLFNLAGTPALSVPCGFVSGGRLPIGMQLVASWWDEATLLRVAHAYERATEWRSLKPPL
jgi:aspartyl-tRNA(Asn)/glutamyl-tRNA(Gln) amidotransferase subunit A